MSALFALALQVAAQPSSSPPTIGSAYLDAISDRCKAPREWLEIRGNEIVLRANPDADVVKIECVLKEISAIVPAPNLSFIGNAQASEEK